MHKTVEFCTCTDRECPFHPVNHDQGCTPCIAKNLKEGEISSCFFNSVDPMKTAERGRYSRGDFVRVVMDMQEK